jgi:RPA family protein
MKKVFTFLLAALLLMSGLTWAQTITWTAADQGYENGQLIESVTFDDHVYAEFFQGTNSNNPPKYYNTGAAIRCYGGNYFTITSDYTLTEITLGFASGDGSNEITTDLGNYADGTWTGSANEVTFTIGGTSGHRRIATFTITYSESGTPNPTITAANVEIAFDATSGSIEYTINNAVTGGELTASTTADWLSLGMVDTTIPFTCTANATAAPRSAAVTLTYTYNTDQTVTKNVTVTQAANPDAVNNISDITAPGTYTVQGTIVAKSARGFMVGDGTGYVYYYNANYTPDDYNIGDMVKLSGSVVVYGGVYEFNNSTSITAAETSNYVAEDPTVITGEQMDARVASTTPPQLSSYVQYEGTLSINGTHYNITNINGATTAMGSLSYPLNVDEITTLDGKQVKVTGYYVGISTSTYYNTMLGSLEEIASTEPSITLDDYDIEVPAEGGEGYINVTYQNLVIDDELLYVDFFDENGDYVDDDTYDWITVEFDANNNVHYVVDVNQGTARTAYFKIEYFYFGNEWKEWKSLNGGDGLIEDEGGYLSNMVTVTQTGNPNVVTSISNITAEGMYTVQGTIVAINNRGFVLGDGTGYVYYYYGSSGFEPDDYAIGDMVKLSGSVVSYGGVFEFTNSTIITYVDESNYVAEEPTVLSGADMDARVASTSPAQLSSYVQYEGTLTVNGNYYNITNIAGATTAMGSISYPLNSDEIAALNGMLVKVTGYYVGISSSTYYNTMIGNIEESTEPAILLDNYEIEVPADGGEGYLNVTYQNLDPEYLGLHVGFYAEDGETMVNYDWITAEIDANFNIHYIVEANQSVARTAYFKVYDDGIIDVEEPDLKQRDGGGTWVGADSYYSNLVTIYQAAYAAPGEWVLTDLTDLTENDIFVIVGTYEDEEHDSYAMSNDNGTSSAPTAVEVTIVDNTLSGEIAENLQWKISGNATDGYTFYPYGNAETWLYCTNANNGVRVGTNSNNTFTFVDGGIVGEEEQAYYLFNSSTERYIGIYNRSDWRCYTSVNNNIKNQSFAFYKKATSTVTQSTELAQGYNWWSTYIEQGGINGLEMLENSLGGNGVAIRSQASGYIDYYGEDYGWWGSLASINNESSYRVVANAPCMVSMTGNEAVPSQHPIMLNHGWTWMGYVPSTAMDVNTAMAGMEASDGDMLKSQQGYADYYPNYGWYGSLNTIDPGMGLMYYSASGETVTFTYPDNTRSGELKKNLTAADNHWKPNIFAYPDNMTVMATIELDGEELNSEYYELAAFASNGECRGSVKLTYVEPINRHVAFLTISGKDAAELSFRLYDTETGLEYYDAEESLDFVTNAIVGTADDLYTIHFRGTTGMDELASQVQVYPNPVNAGERFSINVADDVKKPARVEIINALGVETLRATSVQVPAQLTAPATAGVYTLRITVEGKGTVVRKLVVK